MVDVDQEIQELLEREVMNREEMQTELNGLAERRKELEQQLLQCKERRDRVLARQIRREIKVIVNRGRTLGYKLGIYQYPKDDRVEYAPGQYMDRKTYMWLMGD